MSDKEKFGTDTKESFEYACIMFELDKLSNYWETIENFMEKEKRNINDKNGYDENGFSSTAVNFEIDIARRLRESFFLLLFSFWEENIDEICDLIKKNKRIPLGRKDLSGGIITSAKKYLKAFGHFNLNNIENWPIIEGLYDLRNIFIHGNGNIKKSKLGTTKRLNKLLDMEVGLSKIQDQLYIDSDRFCHFSLESFFSFYEQLGKEHIRIFTYWRVIEKE